MSNVETLFVSLPVSIALSCWLFFEIATRFSASGRTLSRSRIFVFNRARRLHERCKGMPRSSG